MKKRDLKTYTKEDFSSVFVISMDGDHVLKSLDSGPACKGCSKADDENVVWNADFTAGTESQSGPPPCPWTKL
tara:strand:- start:9594 stop:9812 length:219 start_codon:yes stop_codon:yes gene_type:complete